MELIFEKSYESHEYNSIFLSHATGIYFQMSAHNSIYYEISQFTVWHHNLLYDMTVELTLENPCQGM